MSRGKLEFRNPAEAVAAAKCWLNGWGPMVSTLGMATGSFHPEDGCRFCETPRDALIRALEEFIEWGHLSDDDGTPRPLRIELEQWQTLPPEEQLRLVSLAQHEAPPEASEPPPAVERPKREAWWTD